MNKSALLIADYKEKVKKILSKIKRITDNLERDKDKATNQTANGTK